MDGPRTLAADSVAWMERRMPQSISAVHIDDSMILAGDWNGAIVAWNLEGEELWSANVGDRVTSFEIDPTDQGIRCIAGREAMRINPIDGDILWRTEFDGSTDMLRCANEGRCWVSSSVYDIELNDFVVCAITHLDADGMIIHRLEFDERPWSLHILQSGGIALGLGRPRGGLLILKPEGEVLIEEHLVLGESPVCCGTGQDEILLGHINGNITEISTDGKQISSQSITEETIECMAKKSSCLLIGTTEGKAICYRNGNSTWSVDLEDEIEHICISNEERAWFSTWSGRNGTVSYLKPKSGEIIAHFTLSDRLRDIAVHASFTVIGTDDGRLLVFEEEMLTRRIDSDLEETNERSDLRDRLRALRK
tara:strand:+ start:678 stop:1775 length:1098 start_codon:yes stop_codon:yes gene_type:complete